MSASPLLPPAVYGGIPAACIATGDFTGDGNSDIAVAGSKGIFLLAGKEDGTFAAPVQISSDPSAIDLQTSDFNGDGNLDLLAIDASTGMADVFLGQGSGSFSTGAPFPTVAGAHAAAVGDLSNDGNMDVVVAGDGGLVTLVGNGDGTFATPTLLHSGAYQGVAIDDFDGDGNSDIAATIGNQVQVFLGTGSAFAAPASYPAGADAGAIATGDFNGDFADDLAIATPGNNSIAVLLAKTDADGNATGTFAAPLSVGIGSAAQSIAVGDVTGDSQADLVAGTSSGVVVVPGSGDGSFAPPVTNGASISGDSVAIDDLNGDGFLDVAAADAGNGSSDAGGAAVFLQAVPDLSVAVSGPTSAAIHANISYTITVTNSSTVDASGVFVSDCLPTNATLVSAAVSQGNAGTVASLDVTANLGTLAADSSATLTIVVRPTQYGAITNSATVSSASADSNWSNNFAQAQTHVVAASGAEVEITQSASGGGGILPIVGPVATPIVKPIDVPKTGATPPVVVTSGGQPTMGGAAETGGGSVSGGGTLSGGAVPGVIVPIGSLPPTWWGGSIKVGDPITYTLDVTNYGPETASALIVTDMLPGNTTFVSAAPSQGSADTSTPGMVKVNLGDLPSGASAQIVITVTAAQVGAATNTASVSSSTADPFPDNNTSAVTRYVGDGSTFPPLVPPDAPIAFAGGGSVYAAGAGASAGTSLAASAAATSGAPCQFTVADVKQQQPRKRPGRLVFTVVRKGSRKSTASVHFATADGTAEAGADYLANAGVLTFARGVSRLKVIVPLSANAQGGVSKSFHLELSGAINAAIARSEATATLVSSSKRKAGKGSTVRINFQPAGAVTPAGFLADDGAVFGSRGNGLSYGWDADNTSSAAQRAGPAGQLETTYNVLHSTSADSSIGAGTNWQIALPDGTYQVRVAVSGRTTLQGKLLGGAPARPFVLAARTVKVTHGRLVLAAGANVQADEIAFVEITRR